MGGLKNIFTNKLLLVLVLSFIVIIGKPRLVEAHLSLTQEEKDYIAKSSVIKAVSIDGAAPLHYINSKGEIKGIAIHVLDEISNMTGLIFEYELYDTIEEAYDSDAKVLFGISKNYAKDDFILSNPYLISESILYMNATIKSGNLADKRYVGIEGGKLPDGVNKEKAIYCNNRKDAIEAVEKGKADYGYGNAYSLAYYTLKNDYKNIITIPKGKEVREYSLGFKEEDQILISIINKSISNIEESRMQTFILEAMSQIERELNFSMIMESYGRQVLGISLLIIGVLSCSIFLNIRTKKNLELQNKKYELLSHISNECLYEYNLKTGELFLSEKCYQMLGTKECLDKTADIIKDNLSKLRSQDKVMNMKIPISKDEERIFRTFNSIIYSKHGDRHEIIGKLMDISKETKEKEKLIKKSQIDGLTGLYNATTTRELVSKRLLEKDPTRKDVFIIIDCDKFKDINDSYGHLVGDRVLENVSKALIKQFDYEDIIGRIGGDEFLVYSKNMPSIDYVCKKGKELVECINQLNEKVSLSLSIGFTFVKDETIYDELFKKADKALYRSKKNGGGEIVLYDKELS